MFASNSPSLLAVGQLSASMLALLSAPIVARAIGPEGRGETAAVLALVYIWPLVVSFGLPLEVRRVVASTGDVAIARTARLWALLSLIPSVAVAAGSVTTIFAPLALDARIAAFFAVSLAPLAVSWMCDQSVLITRSKYARVAILQITQPALYVVTIAVGWPFGLVNVSFVIWANVAALTVAFVLAWSLTKVPIFGARAPLLETLRKSTSFAGSTMTDAATNRMDQLLALPIIGGYGAGIYAVAATVGALAMPLGHSLGASSFNSVARAQPTSRELEIQSRMREAMALSVVSAAALILVIPVAVPLLFGTSFRDAIVPAMICAAGGAAGLTSYVGMMSLAAAGRGYAMTASQIVRLVVSLALLVVLGGIYGALGAALASCIASWALLLMLATRTPRGLRVLLVRWRDLRNAVRRFSAT